MDLNYEIFVGGRLLGLRSTPFSPTFYMDVIMGTKFDKNKIQYDLIDPYALEDMARVLTHGAIKYDRYNWKNVEKHRYEAAMMRHFEAYRKKESYDPESGVSHLAHAMVNLMFLYCFEKEE